MVVVVVVAVSVAKIGKEGGEVSKVDVGCSAVSVVIV